MSILPHIEDCLNSATEALLDTVSLVTFATPLIAYVVIRPYVLERKHAEEALATSQKEKETILQDRNSLLAENVAKAIDDLQRSEERYMLASKGANDGLLDYDLVANKIYFSERWKEMLGYAGDAITNDPSEWFSRIYKEDAERFFSIFEKSKTESRDNNFQCDYRMVGQDHKEIWIQARWITVFDDHGYAIRVVGAHTDITDRKRLEQRLQHDALHDRLTGLPNRSLLDDRMSQSLLHYKRKPKERFALLLIDLDNFKRVNDSLGHTAGDILLIEISKRLKKIMRASDTLARLGGDEFAILMHDFTNIEGLQRFIGRIFDTVTKPYLFEQMVINPRLSIGAVVSDREHRKSTHNDLLADADLALYKAKANGKSTYSIFELPMRDKVSQQFEVANSLVGAIKRGEIFFVYQPIIDIQKGTLGGFEALMRWRHPRYNWISPTSFIPLAEESDIIHELGDFAIEKACEQLASWDTSFKGNSLFITINVSGRQLEKVDIIETLIKTAKKWKINPSRIKCEVTETALITSGDQAVWILREIKKHGFHLAIDDFGMGHSSLSTLYQYPFDTLKIDRLFLSDITSNKKSQSMVKSINILAKSLHMKTVAEGVEHEDQVNYLKHLGCDYIQGYYFSKPQESIATEAFIKRWNLTNRNEKGEKHKKFS